MTCELCIDPVFLPSAWNGVCRRCAPKQSRGDALVVAGIDPEVTNPNACHECGGRGEVFWSYDVQWGEDDGWVEQAHAPCPKCGGSGESV